MLRSKLFDGEEKEIEVYNQVAIIDLAISFFTVQCSDGEETETDFSFPDFASAYFRVFNERLGRRIKNIVLTQSGNELVMNASVSDMTFEQNGNYYYEIGYTVTGGYEFPLRYGKAIVI